MITGGIKFFNKNVADTEEGATASASSGDASVIYILDKNIYTVWRSVGSDDLTTETIIVTLSEATTFDRLFLINHNIKEYTVKYWDGVSAYVDFANVIGVNGDVSATISENDYDIGTSYYEFTEVSSNKLEIKFLKTQVVDAEKFLNSLVVTDELGTLDGFPIVKDATKNKNLRKSKLLNGKMFVTKSLETMSFTIDFKNYPAVLGDDLDLMRSLFEMDPSFLVWLCGGRNGTPYFKYQLVGFRLRDLIQVQVTNKLKEKYKKNYYNGVITSRYKIEESA